MSRAEYRKVYGKRGSGRFVVSEGVTLGCHFGPYETATPDPDFPIIMPDGTIYGENNEQPRED